MSSRPYTLRQRAASRAATRLRILEATMVLHGERGILGTSLRAVAARAGVSPATVLQHFPDLDALVEGCGQLTAERLPFPGPALLEAVREPEARLEALVRACSGYWQGAGEGLERLELERRALPRLDRFLRELEAAHHALCAAALRPLTRSPRALRLAVVLTGHATWRALHRQGATAEAAVADILSLLLAWLHRDAAQPGSRRSARAGR